MTDTRIYQQHINKKMEESLSALVDGEASDLEVRRVLKACDKKSELRECWRRYHVVSQVLKDSKVPKNNSPDISVDLSACIREAIVNEPSLNINANIDQSTSTVKTTNVKRSAKSFWYDAGRFAIAASVAAAVVLGVQYTSVDQSPAPAAFVSELSTSLPGQVVYKDLASKNIVETVSHLPNGNKPSIQINKQPITISSEDLKVGSNDMQDLQRQLNRLMLEHIENASQNNYQGILPYARVPSGEQ
jgi:sigma-E factor negative regulatory protein RseA